MAYFTRPRARETERVPDVWGVMRAIRASDLPATDRHILMTLASLADAETAVIPDRFMPSLTDLSRQTGYGRSTVARRLNAIEDAGWVKRAAPTVQAAWRDKDKTNYTLCVPVSTSPAAGLVPERDQSQNGTSPAAGHEVPDQETSSSKRSRPAQKRAKKPRVADIPRPDVDEICEYLADKIEANGSKRPTITAEWRKDGRLLLDEKRPIQPDVAKVKRLIDWCQADIFWRTNVLSMPTLRKQWDRLRLDALADLDKQKRQAEREREDLYAKPPSTAPKVIPPAERCTRHPSFHATSCGPCRADRLAGKRG